MDLSLIIKAIAALAVLSVIVIVLLGTASKKFAVEVDPNVERILEALPGGNCGACGNPSCFSAAEAIAAGRAEPNTCVAGGKETAEKIAAIIGKTVEFNPVVSVRHCGGGVNARKQYDYAGLGTCAAVSRLAGGSLVCGWGCLGYGDCARACPFDAIRMDDRGLPVIDLEKCTGCGICVKECPRGGTNLLKISDENLAVAVRCSSHDRAKERRSYCTMCCIGCKKCEKVCPTGAIVVEDNLAVVDPRTCIACYSCIEVCPQDCLDVHGRASAVDACVADGLAKSCPGFAVDAAAAEAARESARAGEGA